MLAEMRGGGGAPRARAEGEADFGISWPWPKAYPPTAIAALKAAGIAVNPDNTVTMPSGIKGTFNPATGIISLSDGTDVALAAYVPDEKNTQLSNPLSYQVLKTVEGWFDEAEGLVIGGGVGAAVGAVAGFSMLGPAGAKIGALVVAPLGAWIGAKYIQAKGPQL